MSTFDKETLQAMIDQKQLVIEGALLAMDKARTMLLRGLAYTEVTAFLAVEGKELDTQMRTGRRQSAAPTATTQVIDAQPTLKLRPFSELRDEDGFVLFFYSHKTGTITTRYILEQVLKEHPDHVDNTLGWCPIPKLIPAEAACSQQSND